MPNRYEPLFKNIKMISKSAKPKPKIAPENSLETVWIVPDISRQKTRKMNLANSSTVTKIAMAIRLSLSMNLSKNSKETTRETALEAIPAKINKEIKYIFFKIYFNFKLISGYLTVQVGFLVCFCIRSNCFYSAQ